MSELLGRVQLFGGGNWYCLLGKHDAPEVIRVELGRFAGSTPPLFACAACLVGKLGPEHVNAAGDSVGTPDAEPAP